MARAGYPRLTGSGWARRLPTKVDAGVRRGNAVRGIAVVVLAALLVLGLGGIATAGSPAPVHLTGGTSTGKHVFDIGDSITDLDAPDLTRALARFSYVIEATVGITMARSLPAIQHEVATTPPQDWIIELGTNDLSNPGAVQALNNEVAAVADQSCVILVTPSPLLSSIEKALDQRMVALTALDKKVHVLAWGTIEYQNPKWVFDDLVHPSIKGQAKLASLERWALKADCPRS
jgi:hypothetical protein